MKKARIAIIAALSVSIVAGIVNLACRKQVPEWFKLASSIFGMLAVTASTVLRYLENRKEREETEIDKIEN